jgi:prolyl oligopeptidase
MRKSFIPIILMAVMAGCNTNTEKTSNQVKLTYPTTKKDSSVKDNYFGKEITDPYRWLENDTSSETAEWVKAENAVTNAYLQNIPFREAIKKRYTELYNYEKFSAPFKYGGYTYYFRNSGLQNQSVMYREKDGGGASEVFLDPNTFSTDGTTSLAGIDFSKDGTVAAYLISEGGSDWRKVIILNAVSNTKVGDTLTDVKFSGISWKNTEGFYYSSYDKPKDGSALSGKTQEHKLYYHKAGTLQKDDQLVFGGSKTPRRYISGQVTENQRWLIISAANETYGNELYVQDLSKQNAPVVPIISGMKNAHNVVDADDEFLFIETDLDAPNNKLVKVPVASPSPENWITVIETKKEVLSVGTGGGYFFGNYLKDAVSVVYQYDKTGKLVREVQLPGLGTATGFNAKMDDKELYYTYTSYTQPATIYKMDIASGNTAIYKQPSVKFNPAEYESKQVFYPSKDGTKIPLILTYKKGLQLNGRNPCLLYGYGGFNVSLTPSFSTSTVILLENGGIYAVANLRGGGEYGKEWHTQGIKTKKQNVFDDFIYAAKFLVDSQYTSKEYLAIRGGSNGGLLVGACMTQQPGMCKVAFPAVGVMDMLRYHKFTAGAGWAYDYGTSEESKEMFDYILAYSPLHNLKPAAYPATLVTTADHDDRVVPAHSFKFAATLQENQQGSNPVLIRIESKAGHGAGRSTEQVIDEQTDVWSFMFYNMGLHPYK